MASTTTQTLRDRPSTPPQTKPQPLSTGPAPASNEAATKLVEAIDDFLGDIERKFKGISDEILVKLDDMAERCDRLEQQMLLRDREMQSRGGRNAPSDGDEDRDSTL